MALSDDVKGKKEIAEVGFISSNNDPTIGESSADAMDQVGKDGVITVEDGKTADTTLDLVEGMESDPGYSPALRHGCGAHGSGVGEPVVFLLHEKKINR